MLTLEEAWAVDAQGNEVARSVIAVIAVIKVVAPTMARRVMDG